jgi:hypothetical protein
MSFWEAVANAAGSDHVGTIGDAIPSGDSGIGGGPSIFIDPLGGVSEGPADGGLIGPAIGPAIPPGDDGIGGGPSISIDPLGGMSQGPADGWQGTHDPNHGGEAHIALLGGTGGFWNVVTNAVGGSDHVGSFVDATSPGDNAIGGGLPFHVEPLGGVSGFGAGTIADIGDGLPHDIPDDPLGGMSQGPADGWQGTHDPNHGGEAHIALLGGTSGFWDQAHTDLGSITPHGAIELHTTSFETQLHI